MIANTFIISGSSFHMFICPQANLAVQEARLAVAMSDLNTAQAQLDDKNRELAAVMAMYDAAMAEKQVTVLTFLLQLDGFITF